jgi:hypothetical protein
MCILYAYIDVNFTTGYLETHTRLTTLSRE